MSLRILIAEVKDFSPTAAAILADLGTVDLTETTGAELTHALNTYDVLWFRLGFRVEACDLPAHPRCRFIVCPVTGLDHIDVAACAARGIQVLSLRGESAFLTSVRATAELTIGLALALFRKIPQAANHVGEGGWNRDLFKGRELFGKSVGVAGMGRLGKIAAQYFRAFGCRVAGYDPVPFEEDGVTPCESLQSLVAQSDLLSIHINLTPQTRHLFNDAILSGFKRGSVLVNTSRGGLIDSLALLRHLESGHLAGAALDVIENEHAHVESPLVAYARRHDHVLITPHIGGNTVESFEKTEVFMAEKLRAVLQR